LAIVYVSYHSAVNISGYIKLNDKTICEWRFEMTLNEVLASYKEKQHPGICLEGWRVTTAKSSITMTGSLSGSRSWQKM
jgi:hypothetical protein